MQQRVSRALRLSLRALLGERGSERLAAQLARTLGLRHQRAAAAARLHQRERALPAYAKVAPAILLLLLVSLA